MLARTFLTAKQLGCAEADRQAAIAVLDDLERGKLRYVDLNPKYVDYERSKVLVNFKPQIGGFNMGVWSMRSEDGGFVGCIGFYMECQKRREVSDRTMTRWRDLFEPAGYHIVPYVFTVARCARALHAKLTTGRADWSEPPDERIARMLARWSETDEQHHVPEGEVAPRRRHRSPAARVPDRMSV